MVKCWYMDNDTVSDRREPHQENPPRFLSLEQLVKYGVDYWKIDSEESLQKVLKEGGYNYQDEITCNKDCLKNYEQMMEKFYEEHLHTDPETRMIVEGVGYFDIRSPESDKWIRVELEAGDMISIPAGIYHRFTPSASNHVKAKRFFVDPVWTPYNRSDGVHASNADYLKSVLAN